MDDLISRQAAIEVIDAVFPVNPTKSEYAQGLACGAALAKTYVKQLPSAQPRWIPVTERLPEARQSVILSTENWTGEGCYWETTEYHVIWKGYRWKATYWDDEVIAWMPLPEPARLERD